MELTFKQDDSNKECVDSPSHRPRVGFYSCQWALACMSILPFRSWISHVEASIQQQTGFTQTLTSVWGAGADGYGAHELPSSAHLGFHRHISDTTLSQKPSLSLNLLLLQIISSSVANLPSRLGDMKGWWKGQQMVTPSSSTDNLVKSSCVPAGLKTTCVFSNMKNKNTNSGSTTMLVNVFFRDRVQSKVIWLLKLPNIAG